jgi:hypothetical protein
MHHSTLGSLLEFIQTGDAKQMPAPRQFEFSTGTSKRPEADSALCLFRFSVSKSLQRVEGAQRLYLL